MSRDESAAGSGGSQRPGRLPVVPPGPLYELKALLNELHLRAAAPTLDAIAAWVADDDDLLGAPSRDTINRSEPRQARRGRWPHDEEGTGRHP